MIGIQIGLQRLVSLYVVISSFATPSLAQSRLFFSLTETNKLCQVLDVEFSITVTARLFPVRENDVSGAISGEPSTRNTGKRILRWCNRHVVMHKFCQLGENVDTSWIGLRFPQFDAVLNFNFSADGDLVYLHRSFVFDARTLFSHLAIEHETVSFEDPNVLTVGGVHNSYHCTKEETTSYVRSNPGRSQKNDATYTVSVNTKSIRVQAFGLDEPPSGLLGPVITCEDKSGSYNTTTAAIVGSAVAVVILVLVVVTAFVLIKRRREYDEIDDD